MINDTHIKGITSDHVIYDKQNVGSSFGRFLNKSYSSQDV